jgi:spore coat polysaccharide biosynthesis protein SpsF
VLLPLIGEPVLVHVVRRVSRAALLDAVVVATTTAPGDDPIEALAAQHGWALVRGSEEDLLDRYLLAARTSMAGRVVRVTSDCPLIDPSLIDAVVAALVDSGADYASNTLPPRTYPRGLDVEAFTMAALERAGREDEDPARREHATPYLYRNPDRFRLVSVPGAVDHSDHRWTLDTPDDYALISRIYDALGSDDFAWTDVLALLSANPDWKLLNSHVVQK